MCHSWETDLTKVCWSKWLQLLFYKLWTLLLHPAPKLSQWCFWKLQPEAKVWRQVDEALMASLWCCINAGGHERPAYPVMSSTPLCSIQTCWQFCQVKMHLAKLSSSFQKSALLHVAVSHPSVKLRVNYWHHLIHTISNRGQLPHEYSNYIIHLKNSFANWWFISLRWPKT